MDAPASNPVLPAPSDKLGVRLGQTPTQHPHDMPHNSAASDHGTPPPPPEQSQTPQPDGHHPPEFEATLPLQPEHSPHERPLATTIEDLNMDQPALNDHMVTQLIVFQKFEEDPLTAEQDKFDEDGDERREDPNPEMLTSRIKLYKHLSGATVFSVYSVKNEEEDLGDASFDEEHGVVDMEAEYDVEGADSRKQKHEFRILVKTVNAPIIDEITRVKTPRPVETMFSSVADLVEAVKKILVIKACQSQYITTKLAIVDDSLLSPAFVIPKPIVVSIPLHKNLASIVTVRIIPSSFVLRTEFDMEKLFVVRNAPPPATTQSGTATAVGAVTSGAVLDAVAAAALEGEELYYDDVTLVDDIAMRQDLILDELIPLKPIIKPTKRRHVRTLGVRFQGVLPMLHDAQSSSNDPQHRLANTAPPAPTTIVAHHALLGRKFCNARPNEADGSDLYGPAYLTAINSRHAVHNSSVGPRQTLFPYMKDPSTHCWRTHTIASPVRADVLHSAQLNVKRQKNAGAPSDAEQQQQALPTVPTPSGSARNGAAAKGLPTTTTVDQETLNDIKRILPAMLPPQVPYCTASTAFTVVLAPRPPPPVPKPIETMSWSRRFCPFYGPDQRFAKQPAEQPVYDVTMYSAYDRPALSHRMDVEARTKARVFDNMKINRSGVLESIILSNNDNILSIESVVHGMLDKISMAGTVPVDCSESLAKIEASIDQLDKANYRRGFTRKNAMHQATLNEIQTKVLNHPYRKPSRDDIMMLAVALQRKKDADANTDLQTAANLARRDTEILRKSFRGESLPMSFSTRKSFASIAGASVNGNSGLVPPTPRNHRQSNIKMITDEGDMAMATSVNFFDNPCTTSLGSSNFMSLEIREPAPEFDPNLKGPSKFLQRDGVLPSTRLELHQLELEYMRDQYLTSRFTRTVLSHADIGVMQGTTEEEYEREQFSMEQYIQKQESFQKTKLMDVMQGKELAHLAFSRIPKKV